MNETKLDIEVPNFITDKFSYFVNKFEDFMKDFSPNDPVTYHILSVILQECNREVDEHNKRELKRVSKSKVEFNISNED
jgi:hypothetical protein